MIEMFSWCWYWCWCKYMKHKDTEMFIQVWDYFISFSLSFLEPCMLGTLISYLLLCFPGFRRLGGSKRILFYGAVWHWHRRPLRPREHRPSHDNKGPYHIKLFRRLFLFTFHLNFIKEWRDFFVISLSSRHVGWCKYSTGSKWTRCSPTG